MSDSTAAHYEAIWENATVGLAFVNTAGVIIRANPYLTDFLGYGRGELEGMHFADITASTDTPRDLKQFDALIAGEVDRYTMHKFYRQRMGDLRPAKLTVVRTKIEDSNGALLFGSVLPLNPFEAAGVTKKERSEVLSQAVGELVIKNWRIWLPFLLAVVGLTQIGDWIARIVSGGTPG